MVGLTPHLILRTKRANEVEKDKEQDAFGYVGNILFDRIAGATIHTCTPGEYGRVGSQGLIEAVSQDLESRDSVEKKKVYKIPVGGSNGLGTWGYIEGVEELLNQIDESDASIDHVVFASGSGGTAAGISLGLSLAFHEKHKIDSMPKVHGVGVCDFPDYFYNTITSIAEEMGLDMTSVSRSATNMDDTSIEKFVRESLTIYQGKGIGYASSTPEELNFIVNFALETGISLVSLTVFLRV